MKILVATHNKGKLQEYADLLADLPVEWISLSDVHITAKVEETGETFEENARIKAEAYARLSEMVTLADDSGLEVDALDSAPGVYSARYGGEDLSDEERYQLLLANLENVPEAERKARFVCAIAVATPENDLIEARGERGGFITCEPCGEYGFGYDPVFWVPGYRVTMAELEPVIKNKISHRAMAVKAIYPKLSRLIVRLRDDQVSADL